MLPPTLRWWIPRQPTVRLVKWCTLASWRRAPQSHPPVSTASSSPYYLKYLSYAEVFLKTIFYSANRAIGFKEWSLAHTPADNDDDPIGGGRPVAIRVRAADKPTEQAHRRWLTQGVGNVL